MIITKIHIKNWYSYKDSILDLSYPRKLIDSTIPFEYLENFENIRYKRTIILSGANASGKTSLAKIILAIKSFMKDLRVNMYFNEGYSHKSDEQLYFSFEFLEKDPTKPIECSTNNSYPYSHINQLDVKYDLNVENGQYQLFFKFKSLEIKHSDSIESLRKLLDNMDSLSSYRLRKHIFIDTFHMDTDSEEYLKAQFHFKKLHFTTGWNFLYNDLSKETTSHNNLTKETLEAVLKTFDNSIVSVNDAYEAGNPNETNGFFINFKNKQQIYISQNGEIAKDRHMLSLGTYESVKIANFLSIVLNSKHPYGLTFFLDESMPHVQSEIERSIINLIIQRMNKYSQFFYTTHNYDVLDMNLPIHSYLFLRKNEECYSELIKAEDTFKKNDRSIINYVKNDVLRTLPNTNLLEEILLQD